MKQSDRDLAENRKKPLRSEDLDNPQESIEAPLRDQILSKLMQKLRDDNAAHDIIDMWHQGNNDRLAWLERQNEYLTNVDEFIRPIYKGMEEWNSTLHLPTILTILKSYHSRIFQALMSADPLVDVKARRSDLKERAPKIQELLNYALTSYANKYEGVEEAVDKWIWDWTAAGVGILKGRWEVEYTRFKDVDNTADLDFNVTYDEDGNEIHEVIPTTREIEVDRTLKVFDGPMLEALNFEDVVIIGGEGDPQKATAVIQQGQMNASQLLTLVDRKIFDAEAVDRVLSGGPNYLSSDVTGGIKQQRLLNAGESEVDKRYDNPKYTILEAYVKRDVDGSGIASDLVVWIHKETKEILRATYLYRIDPTGTRPFFKIDFHKRFGATYGVGLVELLYSLGREIDAIHNMNIDVGILTSMPFGFYRAGSSMNDEQIAMEPGALIPVDNPSTDVFFPNLGSRTSFGFQEMQALDSQIQRLTGMSDLNFGVIGGQGATRTATGTRALLGENSANLDIFLKRVNRGWKKAISYMFSMLQQRLPDGFEYRLETPEGDDYWGSVTSREELKGQFDFILDSNSQNTNKQIREITADQIYQMTQNPIDIQLGLITPAERYEALKNKLAVMGVKSISRYIRKPENAPRKYMPIEILEAAIAGSPINLDPSQDIAGVIALAEEILGNDNLLGQLSEQQALAVNGVLQQATQTQAALEQAAAQQAVAQQAVSNAQLPTSVNASVDVNELNRIE